MYKFIIVIIQLMITTSVYAQTQLLKNYDFNKGGYTLLFEQSRGGFDNQNEFIELSNYYIDDISILNEIKKNWVFNKSEMIYACGYHYEVYLCKNGIKIDNFSINLECGQICSSQGYFDFSKDKWMMFQNKLKKAVTKNNKFASLQKARDAHAGYFKQNRLIMIASPDWLLHEGAFIFKYNCSGDERDCITNPRIISKLLKQIQEMYPQEPMNIEFAGSTSTISDEECEFRVRCNKSLAKKFKLYSVTSPFEAYNDYELDSYWKND
jgi:hypothetical protein